MKKQNGIIPAIVLLALALSALLGGFLGYKLGDGTATSFGIGFGIAFFAVLLLGPYIEKFLDLRNRLRKK